MKVDPTIAEILQQGTVIPAHPLALTSDRKLDERYQRALSRYYIAAGAGGLAVGVHTTQFAIHDPKVGLLRPVLELASEEMARADISRSGPLIRVGGICGETGQAVREAELLSELNYHAGLLNLAALRGNSNEAMIGHCRAVAEVIPLFGFFLQEEVGGCPLDFDFWRRFTEIDHVVAIKVAAFDRYRTLDVVRAVAESGRGNIALYTGNDDNIVLDLLTPYRLIVSGNPVERRFVGGLLGHWAVWTRSAVALHKRCREVAICGDAVSQELLREAVEVTDMNAVIFDAANGYAGCVPGILEVLHRHELVPGPYCLDPSEALSAGQAAEIDRVLEAYPHLIDDEFVSKHRDQWLSG